jgi:DNA-directed RNA polymerase sigma subunit (sigma70/sigma32)
LSDDVDAWMRGAIRYPLLTASQELMLSATVRAMLDSPNPTPQQIKRGRAAKTKLINSNLRLAAKCAFSFRRRIQAAGGDLADAMQEAVIGLNRAAEKFDHTRGYKFSTYAVLWCNQAVRRYIDFSTATIRAPINALEVCRRWKYRPEGMTVDEFCQQWELTRERLLRELQHAARASCASLDAPTRGGGNEGDGSNLFELIPDHGSEPSVQGLDLELAVARLEAVLPNELGLVRRWVGGMTRREIAEADGLSSQGVGHRLSVCRTKLQAAAGPEALELLEGAA